MLKTSHKNITIQADNQKEECYGAIVKQSISKDNTHFGDMNQTVKCMNKAKTGNLSIQLDICLFKNTYLGNPTLQDWEQALELAFDEIKNHALQGY